MGAHKAIARTCEAVRLLWGRSILGVGQALAAAILIGSAARSPVLGEIAGTPKATVATNALALTVAKFNAYVTYMNETAEAVSALARYASWVNEKTGPTGRERHVAGIEIASDGGNERAAALKASDAVPALPELDAAIKVYAAADDAVVSIINEAHGYYAREDWKLDRMVGGRAIHARIAAAGPPYLSARQRLEDVISVEKRRLDLISLDTIESREGRSAGWNILNVTMRSKQVVDRLSDERSPRVDTAALDAELVLMGTAVKDLDDYSTRHPEASLTTGMSDDLLADVRRVRERLTAAKGDLRRVDRFAVGMMRTHYDSMLMVIRPPPVVGR